MRSFNRSILAAVVAALLVAACAASAAPTSAPTIAPTGVIPPATPTVTPTAAPAATPTATPVPTTDGEGPELIIGTVEVWLARQYTVEPQGDDVTAIRGGVVTWKYTTNDPRASGTARYEISADVYGPDYRTGVGPEWGPVTLETERGTWEGACTGVTWNEGDGLILPCWLEGTGSLEGWTFYQVTYAPANVGGDRVEGLIYPGSPPAP